MNNIGDRLNRAVAHLKGEQIIRFQQDIVIAMGANKNSISQALKGVPKYLTEDFVLRFCDTYPIINSSWLLTGEGSMLKDTAPTTYPPDHNNVEEPLNTEQMTNLMNRAFSNIEAERLLANRIQDECEKRGEDNRKLISVIEKLTDQLIVEKKASNSDIYSESELESLKKEAI